MKIGFIIHNEILLKSIIEDSIIRENSFNLKALLLRFCKPFKPVEYLSALIKNLIKFYNIFKGSIKLYNFNYLLIIKNYFGVI